ncbi:MAG: acyl carrier protein [Muribaculaceae bacterium]|nr:acyl carrier protein [Muribaculaceae bacterium]
MDMKEFIVKFADIFCDVDPDTLTPETNFRDIDDWSSLSALVLIALASDDYDVELKGDDIRGANTIQDIYDIIKSRS